LEGETIIIYIKIHFYYILYVISWRSLKGSLDPNFRLFNFELKKKN